VALAEGVTKAELIRSALWQVAEENPPPPIIGIGVEPDPTTSNLSPEDREIADYLLAEHDAMGRRDTDTSTGRDAMGRRDTDTSTGRDAG
jgi:hypothetical protein